MNVQIRRAMREDGAIIAKYAQELVRQHQNYDSKRFARLAGHGDMSRFYTAQVERSDAALFVAEQDETVVGFAYVQFDAENYVDLLSNAAWIHDLYVDEIARGAGVGKLLLDAAIKAARSFGADKVMLSVAAQNESAQKLFAQLGFQTTMREMMLDLSESDGSQEQN